MRITCRWFVDYIDAIKSRGIDNFACKGPLIVVDTSDFSKVNYLKLKSKISQYIRETAF